MAAFRQQGFVIVPGVLGAADAAIGAIVSEERALRERAARLEWEPERVDGERIPRRIYHPVHQHATFEPSP